jgi:hypothetical protein
VSVLVPDWLFLADDEPQAGDGKLGDDLACAMVEHGPGSGSALARRVGVRKTTVVLRTLNVDPRFERIGRGAWTRWDVTTLHRLEVAGNRLGTDESRRPTVLAPPTAGDAQDARQRA